MFADKPIVGEEYVSLLSSGVQLPKFTGAAVGDSLGIRYILSDAPCIKFSPGLVLYTSDKFEEQLLQVCDYLKRRAIDGVISWDEYYTLKRNFAGFLCISEEDVRKKLTIPLQKRVYDELNLTGIDKMFAVGYGDSVRLYKSKEEYLDSLKAVYYVCSKDEYDYLMKNYFICGKFYDVDELEKYALSGEYCDIYEDLNSAFSARNVDQLYICEFRVPLYFWNDFKSIVNTAYGDVVQCKVRVNMLPITSLQNVYLVDSTFPSLDNMTSIYKK